MCLYKNTNFYYKFFFDKIELRIYSKISQLIKNFNILHIRLFKKYS